MTTTKDNRVVQPDLFFNSRGEEAIALHRKTPGADVTTPTRFDDSPESSMGAPGAGDKAMRANFRIGGTPGDGLRRRSGR